MKTLIAALIFFASCAPQQKMSKVTGGYTDEGTRLADKTISTRFVHRTPKTKRTNNPRSYYTKSRPFYARAGVNGQLHLYKY